MSHVVRRHGLQRIVQSVGVVSAFQLLFGDVSGVLAVAAELLRESAINSYSREHEHQADMDAVATLQRVQLDPTALADFFAVLQRQQADMPSAFQWLGTHPELSTRIRDVRAESRRLGAHSYRPFDLDWAAVRARSGSHEQDADRPAPTKLAPNNPHVGRAP
jgi:predicted Zn-dependent protease